MVVSCCVYNCTARFNKNASITFHSFPKDEEKRKLWLNAINRKNFVPNGNSRVCSKHFSADQYNDQKLGGRWLKHDAVPSIFDFTSPGINRGRSKVLQSKEKSIELAKKTKKQEIISTIEVDEDDIKFAQDVNCEGSRTGCSQNKAKM